MRAITALLTAIFLLGGCVDDGRKTASGKTIIYEAGNAASGIRITITPPRAERREAKHDFVNCPTQPLVYDYINSGGTVMSQYCYVGPLEGNPPSISFNGRRVYLDKSPWNPKFSTRVF
jgi:hypothetical protein